MWMLLWSGRDLLPREISSVSSPKTASSMLFEKKADTVLLPYNELCVFPRLRGEDNGRLYSQGLGHRKFWKSYSWE